jgi:hypothetical protein
VARLLGLRHLLQAAVLNAHPQLAPVGSVVDFLHAVTDVGAAAADPQVRTPALLDAAIATGLCLSGLRR